MGGGGVTRQRGGRRTGRGKGRVLAASSPPSPIRSRCVGKARERGGEVEVGRRSQRRQEHPTQTRTRSISMDSCRMVAFSSGIFTRLSKPPGFRCGWFTGERTGGSTDTATSAQKKHTHTLAETTVHAQGESHNPAFHAARFAPPKHGGPKQAGDKRGANPMHAPAYQPHDLRALGKRGGDFHEGCQGEGGGGGGVRVGGGEPPMVGPVRADCSTAAGLGPPTKPLPTSAHSPAHGRRTGCGQPPTQVLVHLHANGVHLGLGGHHALLGLLAAHQLPGKNLQTGSVVLWAGSDGDTWSARGARNGCAGTTDEQPPPPLRQRHLTRRAAFLISSLPFAS